MKKPIIPISIFLLAFVGLFALIPMHKHTSAAESVPKVTPAKIGESFTSNDALANLLKELELQGRTTANYLTTNRFTIRLDPPDPQTPIPVHLFRFEKPQSFEDAEKLLQKHGVRFTASAELYSLRRDYRWKMNGAPMFGIATCTLKDGKVTETWMDWRGSKMESFINESSFNLADFRVLPKWYAVVPRK